MTLALHGVGHFHPPNTISNQFLEDLDIETNDAWIVERTGIRSRRTVLDLAYIRETKNKDVREARAATIVSNTELASRAAERALERAGIDRSDIGLVIAGGSVPEFGTPAEAATIADALDINAPCLDLRSACTSFGAALWFLSLTEKTALPPFVLLALPESVTRSVNYNDRKSAVLWGDAGVAAVLSRQIPGRATITETTFDSRPKGHTKVVVPWAGYFDQEGRTVQTFAIKQTAKIFTELRRTGRNKNGGKTYFVGHQANLRMLESVVRRCELEDEQHLTNVADFGNTATAGSPSVLSERWGKFQPGDQVAMVGVGAGFSWSGAMIRFESTTTGPK